MPKANSYPSPRTKLTRHAGRRMRQRGLTRDRLEALLDNADISRPGGDNCWIHRISRGAARAIGDGRLANWAAVVSDASGELVTIAPLSRHSKYRWRT